MLIYDRGYLRGPPADLDHRRFRRKLSLPALRHFIGRVICKRNFYDPRRYCLSSTSLP